MIIYHEPKRATMKNDHSITGKIALAIGKGIISGVAGTAAMTLSQMLEMRATGRKPSEAPADAVNKVLKVKATDQEHRSQFVQEIHWTYGTLWGLARGVLDLAGVKGLPATMAHYGAVWGAEMVMLPAIDVAPPVKKWGAKEVAKDGLHHLIYASVAGLVYDAIE